MKNTYWWQSWSRFVLWSHVIGVVGFYAILWWRTSPRKEDHLHVLPVQRNKGPEKALTANEAAKEPLVSIIVPARNEERNIRRCVQSLLEQDYANYEVIVVDDGSTDRTGAILDELAHSHANGKHLWVLRLRDELPAGWAGKPHAIHSGVQEAHGDWFLFTDADTWHAPNALRSAITQATSEHADLFTLGAEQELPSFWDRVLMPMAYLGISMLYPPRFVNDPQSPVAVANGQYILIRRQVYQDLGGYGRPDMRATLLDDRDLAHLVKSHHYSLRFIDSLGLVHVHMYHSLGDIWRGWRKNAYLGNRGGLLFVLVQLLGLPMISIIPFLLPLLARLSRSSRSEGISAQEAALATGLELAPLISYRAWLNRQLHVPWYYAFTHPLAGAIFTGILGQSMWRVITKRGVDWRGRQYHDQNARVPANRGSVSSPR
ncbi:glycosyltransferase [Dictyobacter formicarum]|uniref:Glycosyl hydrolase n=1 Tax=Dictyobacter formicarum TaxID=2778368 RepID=A0ABQ3VTT7_9CHLR|nr:glycosyltransferase [Dictyobacter formicarum]GHO88973.1 glycosyl hydrolase [Dictyobacter formicarum]